MKTQIKPSKKIARKVLEVVNAGLVSGVGEPIPGKMCVEAAVNYAMGLPHGDKPTAVRAFKITLNDCGWPSESARAEGMKAIAIAQLGSDQIDQMEFGKLMFLRGTQRLLPFVWRKESENLTKENKAKMLEWCERMEKCETFEEAMKLTKAAAAAYAYASADAAYASADAAYAYAYATAATTTAAADAYACAYAYAYAYAATATDAAAYRHQLLKMTADVCLEVLKELKSPGCKWLSILEE